jgi:hypothetical protein
MPSRSRQVTRTFLPYGRITPSVAFSSKPRPITPGDEGQLNIPSDLQGVTEIAASGFHSCARTNGLSVPCWGGSNDSGELGEGHPYLNLLPRELSPVKASLTPHNLVKAQCTIDPRNKLLPREIPRSVASLAV